MNRIKGILYAAVSSATFGLAPFFSISLLAIGYSSFEVLTYRWGVATVVLLVFAFLTKCDFHIGYKNFNSKHGKEIYKELELVCNKLNKDIKTAFTLSKD